MLLVHRVSYIFRSAVLFYLYIYTYRKLDHNPIQDHVNLINNTLDELKGSNELSPEIADGLKPSEPKTPRLYILPKIHKEGNPGRPVVSSVNLPHK